MNQDTLNIQRIAAFSYQGEGGNPAGVVITDIMPTEQTMLAVAQEVGYSETAFLHPVDDSWRIRYFAPEIEVPFCGHATIATGCALGEHAGPGTYRLRLNDDAIHIEVTKTNHHFETTLTSPSTSSTVATPEFEQAVLTAFDLTQNDLDKHFPIMIAFAGAKHLVVALNSRERLRHMSYPFDHVKQLMRDNDMVTINLIHNESETLFHSRNAFAFGGVVEDPATGAAAAALAGYLRDINWPGSSDFTILQGVDMGCSSRLRVNYSPIKGEGVKVSGETRHIAHT